MILASGPQEPSPAKLPLGATISLSYATYFYNFADVLRASWLWLVLIAPLSGIVGWLQASWFAEAVASMKQGVIPSRPLELIVLGNLDSLLLVVAGVSIAVAWHRRIILDERPGLSGSNIIARSFWRYVWVGILVCLMVGIPVLAVFLPTFYLLSHSGGASALALLLFAALFVVYLAAIAVFLRLSLLFPARAAGDVELPFRAAWERTSGNTWRILWGIVVCAMLPLMAAQIVLLVLTGLPRPETFADPSFPARLAVIGAISMVYYLLVLPIGIGFLSHAYRHFFRQA
jgi:hypothetical protein